MGLRNLTVGVGFKFNGLNTLWKTNSDLDRLKGSAQASGQALDNLKGKASQAGAALNYAFGQAKNAISGALDVLNKYKMQLGMIAAMGAAIITSSVGVAGDVNEDLNAFEVIFKNASQSTMQWAEEYGNAVQRSKWNVMNWSAQFGAVFTSMGIAESEAANLSKTMVRLGVDLGSVYNRKPAEAVNLLTSALIGNYEATKSLNIILTETDVKAYAYRKGIAATGKELTSLQKIHARMGLMLERGSVAFGDAEKTAYSYTNQLIAFQENLKDLRVEFGQHFLPTFTQGIISVNRFLTTLKSGNMKQIAWITGMVTATFGIAAGLGAIKSSLPFLKDFLFNPKMLLISASIVAIALVVEDLWVALNGGQAVLSPVVNWFRKYGEIVKLAGIALATFFAPAAIFAMVGPIVSIAKAIGFFGWALKFHWLTSIWPAITSVWAFTTALWACPITWIVAGVIALGAVIYLLWKNWDKVVAGFKIGLNWLKETWQKVWNALKAGFNWLKNTLMKAPDWVVGLLAAFMPLIGIPLLIIKNWGKVVEFFKRNKEKPEQPAPENNSQPLPEQTSFGKPSWSWPWGKQPKNQPPQPNQEADKQAAAQLNNATTNRYQTKQNNVAKVEININGGKDPKQTARETRKEFELMLEEQNAAI